MSPTLLNFHKAVECNNKRMRKANNNQYQKNILTARRTRAMRETAKFDSSRWEYTSQYLYDKFNGKLDDPNIHNKGITGFTFSPDKISHQRKLKDF